MSVSVDLINALKRGLRAQGMTYRELAQRMKLSEAAVKRMFSRRAMSLMRLEQVCEVLGLGLAELGAEAGRGQEPMARLAEVQEQALVDEPALMLAMFLSINRWRQEDVMRHFAFTLPQWTALLVKLDRLGIIELLPGNRARPLTARNFRWLTDGPMERHFRTALLGDYFADAFDGDAFDIAEPGRWNSYFFGKRVGETDFLCVDTGAYSETACRNGQLSGKTDSDSEMENETEDR